ncbi:MAG: ABC transporter permease [Magnetospiraceae bacterium]
MNAIWRGFVLLLGLLAIWQGVVWIAGTPPYILPGPGRVLAALGAHSQALAEHGLITLTEILLGLILGTILGSAAALSIAQWAPARRWLLPILVISQAIPVFALAPLLVLWLGYGMASKVAMAVLIIFFPVTAAFLDGLRRTPPGWLDLAATMGGSRWAQLRHVRLPAALPALSSGIRVATAVAPIGAVVGEWVGSSEGLGFLMLHAQARIQIDLMFAALFVLGVLALGLYGAVDRLLRRWVPWQPES